MIALYNPTDVAVRPFDDRTELVRRLTLRDDEGISSSAKGTIELLGCEVNVHTDFKVAIGDVVYFDPRFVCEIKELGLLVMDYKSLLIKE
jgi:hypothetical protein